MMHPTEEALAEYAFDPDTIPNRRELEAHVADCPACSTVLTFILSVDAGLADGDAWSITEHDGSTREEMRDLAGQAAEEDHEASELLADLLENPARAAWQDLGTQPRYHTAGVVRRLLGVANEACYRAPIDALTFADTASEIAERLTRYAPPILHDLRGTAWKERTNALRLLGRYDAALEALTHAEREFLNVPTAPLGRAMVAHARGIIHYDRGEYSPARQLLQETADACAALGEIDRYMRARHFIANILYREQDIPAAKAIYEEILAWGQTQNDLSWIARAHLPLGHCARQVGDFSQAVQHFHFSAQAFRELGQSAEVTRAEWGFALVMLSSGKPAEALTLFQPVRVAFHDREMVTEEALVALDMMDAHCALNDKSEIVTLASEIIQTFTEIGMLTSALMAFAYLKEAARRGTVEPRQVEHVRQFLSRLQRDPAHLFLPSDERYR